MLSSGLLEGWGGVSLVRIRRSPTEGAISIVAIAGGWGDAKGGGLVASDGASVVSQSHVRHMRVILVPIAKSVDAAGGTPRLPPRFPGASVSRKWRSGVAVDGMTRGAVDGNRGLQDDIANADARALRGGWWYSWFGGGSGNGAGGFTARRRLRGRDDGD